MKKRSADYNKGYQDAIKKIKEQLNSQSSQSSLSNNQNTNRDKGTDSNGNKVGQVSENDLQISNDKDYPNTVGGIINKSIGDQIREAENMNKVAGSESQLEQRSQECANDARKVAEKKQQGDTSGPWSDFISKIANLYNVTTNWRKELKKIVGICISPLDKRSAYANKNVLVSQDRIYRTSKDKYESLNYIIAAVDVSGSMDEKQQMMCLKEVYQTALQKNPLKIYIIYFDTEVLRTDEFKSIKDLEKYMKKPKYIQGGGTSAESVFKYLRTDPKFKGKKAELLMIFTDGYIDQPKRDMKTTKWLVWIITNNPIWELKNNDSHTKVVYLKSEDIK